MLVLFDETSEDLLIFYNIIDKERIKKIVETLDQSLPLTVFPLRAKKKFETNKKRSVDREDLGRCQKSKLKKILKDSWPYYRLCSKLKNCRTTLLGCGT